MDGGNGNGVVIFGIDEEVEGKTAYQLPFTSRLGCNSPSITLENDPHCLHDLRSAPFVTRLSPKMKKNREKLVDVMN